MKALIILLMLAVLSLAACYGAPTSYLGEVETSLAAQLTALGHSAAATQTAQAVGALTPQPAGTPGPGLVPTKPGLSGTPILRAETPTAAPAAPVAPPGLQPPPGTPATRGASVTLNADLNMRTGPGVSYDRIGWLAAGTTLSIIGRTPSGDWWQIALPDAPAQPGAPTGVAWISAGYGTASDIQDVPVVAVPPAPAPATPTQAPPPAPTSTSSAPAPPPPPPSPVYQYTPTGWWGDTNYGLTRFLGEIRDTAGNPINGVFVRATCGDFATISYPSGPVGWGPVGESSDWPPGFYDITVDTKPVPCMWTLQVVDTNDRETVNAELSEAVPVEVTNEQSIIQANWQKNW